MSAYINGVIIIKEEPKARCDLCGKLDELRPYGPGGKCICFDCAMKDKATTEHNMVILLFGDKGELK